jgi:type IV pilus assembly protein PilW
MMNSAVNHNTRQQGFSMVEILVALTISLLLLGGVLQIFVSSKQAYRVQENLSRVQENGRFSVDYLGRYIRLAGYRADLSITRGETFKSPNLAITGTNDNGTNGSDTITIRFQSDGNMRDCLGSVIAPTPNTFATNTFQVSINNDLVCTTPAGQQLCQDPPVCANVQAQPSNRTETIVEGVQDMQIQYGEDTDGDKVANRYVAAGTAGLDMSRVVSIRISLLLQTLDNNLTDVSQPIVYNGVQVIPAAGDLRLRRVYTTTITLRNQLP